LARAQRRSKEFISSSRPTSGLSVDPRNASNRFHDEALSQHLPTARQLGAAVDFDCAKLVAVEQIADQAPGHRIDRHRVRLRRYLQPYRQVGGVADNFVVPTLINRGGIADNDHARRDADPASHRRVGIGSQGPDRSTQFEPRANRLLAIVLMRRGIAEKREHIIPEMPVDEPFVVTGRV
jgi:hypothetical protein